MKFTSLILCLFLLILYGTPDVEAQQTREVTLAGFNQVPPKQTPAMGLATVSFESDTLYVSGSFSDLRGSYRSAHIHYGEEGKTGNSLFRLRVKLNEERTSGTFTEENRFYLNPRLKQALRDGNLYISITSAHFRQGEIRGQIPAIH